MTLKIMKHTKAKYNRIVKTAKWHVVLVIIVKMASGKVFLCLCLKCTQLIFFMFNPGTWY